MRILAVVPYPVDTAPGQRFRIEQWAPLLRRDHGVELEFAPFIDADAYQMFSRRGCTMHKIATTLRGLARRVADVASAKKWDAAYLYREAAVAGPALFERLLARRTPYVFDLDDALFLPAVSTANRAFSFLKFPRKVSSIARYAAHVMSGNQYLADFVSRFNEHVTVIPTTIDTDKYQPRPHANGQIPVIGWSGSMTTAVYIQEMRDVFAELGQTHRFRLRIIGAEQYDAVPGVPTDVLPWASATEVRDLLPIDIGVMPLRDDPWGRGKCGLKALQYMALGTPAVCANVGVNPEIIRHGENGFLASTRAEWLARLRDLLDSAPLRQRMGAAARATVEERYSAHSQVPRLAELFRTVAARKARA